MASGRRCACDGFREFLSDGREKNEIGRLFRRAVVRPKHALAANANDATINLARRGPGQAIQKSKFINHQSSIANPAKPAKARRRLRAGGED